jgi:arginase
MKGSRRGVVLLGVPSAAGAGAPGIEQAPRALREAGLIAALAERGQRVVDLVDLSLFPFRPEPGRPRSRNAAVVACAIAATADEVAGVSPDRLLLVLGGGCSLLAGVVQGLARRDGHAPGVVLIDAHADLNTPETTGSGLLDGMALSLALGEALAELWTRDVPRARPEETALLAYRELDPPERVRLGALALALSASAVHQSGIAVVAERTLAVTGSGRLVVHLDVDALDPTVMPAKDGSPPGPGLTRVELDDLLARLLASPRAAALLVTGFNPSRDPDRRWARLLSAILSEALSRDVDPA